MTTLDKYLNSGLKALDVWRPALRGRLGRSDRLRRRREAAQAQPAAEPETAKAATESAGLPVTLEAALERLGETPAYGALIGVCEDGLPFVLDLSSPAPGAILIHGESGSGKTRLIHAILGSMSKMNSPEQVEFSVIAAQPEEYFGLGELEHCQEIFPVEDEAAGELILELAEIAEQRKRGRSAGPALALAIDDLQALLPFLSEQQFSRLYWLIRHGQRYQVWTFAALSSEQAESANPRFLSAFRTQLFGYMRNERLAGKLAGEERIATGDLEKGRQFYVPYGGERLRFWVCE